MAENFASENPKLSLARLGINMLPDALSTSSRVIHITVLDLKHNSLQLLPSELFLCLTQLEEIDVSQVGSCTNQPRLQKRQHRHEPELHSAFQHR